MDIETLGESAIRSNTLGELPCGAQKTSLSRSSPSDHCPITTSLFDLYKIGPGPSSSHTIGPMKICNDFLATVKRELVPKLGGQTCEAPRPNEPREYSLLIHLHGSLSATGIGHGTHNAVIGGLLGWTPESCDPVALLNLLKTRDAEHEFPVPELGLFKIGAKCIVWHDPTKATGLYHPNTLRLQILVKLPLVDCSGEENLNAFVNEYTDGTFEPHTVVRDADDSERMVIFEREYYSVGGGFVEKKGCPPEDRKEHEPLFRYSHYEDVLEHCSREHFDLVEFMLQNEEALTACSRKHIMARIAAIVECMDRSVERGLASESSVLPGPIALKRKAKSVYESARKDGEFNYLGFLNAYAMAASEENAAGMIVVTAPTSGSAGVIPGVLYFMKHHLGVSDELRHKSLICGGLIGCLVKHNASISGAEMGCMGEIGVASSMAAAMFAYAIGYSRLSESVEKQRLGYDGDSTPTDAGGDTPLSTTTRSSRFQSKLVETLSPLKLFHKTIEAAAEIALEHHLGMTCDPIGGFVQIPCIQRNSMGAVKAFNAHLLAKASDPYDQKISYDNIIDTMKRTGQDMNSKYKETSQGGLALLTVAHSEC